MNKRKKGNDCLNCKHIKKKDATTSERTGQYSDRRPQYVLTKIYTCKLHPKYNDLETFPFSGEMPCWEGKDV